MGYREAPLYCRECGATMAADAGCCTRCGTERVLARPEPAAGMGLGKGLGSALSLCLVMIVLGLMPWAIESSQPLELAAGVIALLVLVVGAWAYRHRDDLREPLRQLGGPADWVLVAFALPIMIALTLANEAAVELLIPGYQVYDLFVLGGYSLPAVLVLSVLCPALIDELAFRGIVYERLAAIFDARTAVVISAALFAIVCLNVLGAVPLLALGLAAGGLRLHSGSLYPGFALHLLYSAAMVALLAI